MCKKLPERALGVVLLLRQINHTFRFALRTFLRFPTRSPEPHLPIRTTGTNFGGQINHVFRFAFDARRAGTALHAEPLHFIRTTRALAAPGLLGLLRQREVHHPFSLAVDAVRPC